MNNPQLGAVLLCGICLVPFITGALLGWSMRGRVIAYGMPGALLPGFVRRYLEEH